MTPTETEPNTDAPFSARIRASTMAAHREAERAPFVHRLMRGQLDLAAIADLAAQHLAIYRAIEAAGEALAADPVVAPFLDVHVQRVPALESDLCCLLGPDWAESVRTLPATARYAQSVADSEGSPERFVAHHYTRLMGDVSGGQMIRRTLVRTYGKLVAGALNFYDFPGIDDLDGFKAEYRARLDEAGWDDSERDAFLDQVNHAYRSNSEVFEQLGLAHRDR